MTPFGNPSGKGRGPSKERGPSASGKGPSSDPGYDRRGMWARHDARVGESRHGKHVVNGRRYIERYHVLKHSDGGRVKGFATYQEAVRYAKAQDAKNREGYLVYDAAKPYAGDVGAVVYDTEVGEI